MFLLLISVCHFFCYSPRQENPKMVAETFPFLWSFPSMFHPSILSNLKCSQAMKGRKKTQNKGLLELLQSTSFQNSQEMLCLSRCLGVCFGSTFPSQLLSRGKFAYATGHSCWWLSWPLLIQGCSISSNDLSLQTPCHTESAERTLSSSQVITMV